jgi:hypothetical protein
MKSPFEVIYRVLVLCACLALPGCEQELPTAGPDPAAAESLRGDWVATDVTGRYVVGTAPGQTDTLVNLPVSDRVVNGVPLADTLSIRSESGVDTFNVYNRSELLPAAGRVVNGGRWFVAKTNDPEGPGSPASLLRLGRFVPARGTAAARWFYGTNANANPASSFNNGILYTLVSTSESQFVVSYTLARSVPVSGVDLAGNPNVATLDVLHTVTFTRL